ncbi:MAG: methyltransferase domain-containing protein [Aestuariivirga sp.]
MSIDSTCMICGNEESVPYFKKAFGKYGLGVVEYRKCDGCDFVFSKTHNDMTDAEWGTLNRDDHAGYQSQTENSDDPRWVARINAQASLIDDCRQLDLIPTKRPWLDFAAGGGQLSTALRKISDLTLLNYDRYLPSTEPKSEPALGAFNFVITTSVFEHFRTRPDLDAIQALVSPEGVMGVHTLVGKQVPADPDWFYLLPVHTSFFSIKSMGLLFSQWGYKSSLYEVDSRLWPFFKRPYSEVQAILDKANARKAKPTYFREGRLQWITGISRKLPCAILAIPLIGITRPVRSSRNSVSSRSAKTTRLLRPARSSGSVLRHPMLDRRSRA